MLVRELSSGHEIIGTVRESPGKNLPLSSFIDSSRIRFGVCAENNYGLTSLLEVEQPNVVLNCIGVVKQLRESKHISTSEIANSKLPHFLSQSCALVGARLIHFSTDCVFSGRTGNYKESDPPDPTDNYGETKMLGELRNERDLTLRTSFVGRPISPRLWCSARTSPTRAKSASGATPTPSASSPWAWPNRTCSASLLGSLAKVSNRGCTRSQCSCTAAHSINCRCPSRTRT